MPDPPDMVLCSKLCRRNQTDPIFSQCFSGDFLKGSWKRISSNVPEDSMAAS